MLCFSGLRSNHPALQRHVSYLPLPPCDPIVWNPSELKSRKDAGTLGPAVYRNLCQRAYLVLLSKFFCISAQRRSISLESWKWGQASINKTGRRTPLPLQLATSEKPSHSWGTPPLPSPLPHSYWRNETILASVLVGCMETIPFTVLFCLFVCFLFGWM